MERQVRRVNLSNIMSRAALPLAKASSTEIGAISWQHMWHQCPAPCHVCLDMLSVPPPVHSPATRDNPLAWLELAHRLPALPHSFATHGGSLSWLLAGSRASMAP